MLTPSKVTHRYCRLKHAIVLCSVRKTQGRYRVQRLHGLDSPPTILNSYSVLLVKQDTIQQLFHERTYVGYEMLLNFQCNSSFLIAGMSPVWQSFQDKGISDAAAKLIMASWRDGTKKQYSTYITKWQKFCNQRQISHIQNFGQVRHVHAHVLSSRGKAADTHCTVSRKTIIRIDNY